MCYRWSGRADDQPNPHLPLPQPQNDVMACYLVALDARLCPRPCASIRSKPGGESATLSPCGGVAMRGLLALVYKPGGLGGRALDS